MSTSRSRAACLVALLLASSAALQAQETAYDSAYFAWEAGRYVPAIDGLLRVLRSPHAAAYDARIALLTGELYIVIQVARDGRNLKWSSNGQFLLVEAGSRSAPQTTIFEYGDGKLAAVRSFAGGGAGFRDDAHVVYFREEGDTASGVVVSVPDSQGPPAERGVRTAGRTEGAVIAALVASVAREGAKYELLLRNVATGDTTVLKKAAYALNSPTVAPDGKRVVYQAMPHDDWEVYVIDADGSHERRLTREPEHDRLQRFIDSETLLLVTGEGRHHRSYVYDLVSGERQRLFHNNTIRTIAPEYDWYVRPGGNAVLVVADRDGNTASEDRGVFLVDLTRKVSRESLIVRLETMRTAELRLHEHAAHMFARLRNVVIPVVRDVSKDRLYKYARDLNSFDSKHINRPGNRLGIEYLEQTLRAFGYDPELQWLEPQPGVRTANVVATLRGTRHPERVFVMSSHFDSVDGGPGADDNGSGTTALLEIARVLAMRPQAATIQFVFLTGEEAGLLGSREFVRRARDADVNIAGVLNNDMIGWRNDQRLDNTIRYSHEGMRDLLHSAAFLFTNLITYDAQYYQNTDAIMFYLAYGDIVAGIGSHPMVANPNYHSRKDGLESVDQQLVAEVAKTTVAAIIWMANSPALPQPVSNRANGLRP